MKITEDTLNGYLMAIAEVNLDANHGCDFYFKKIDVFTDDLDKVFYKHFSSEYNPEYSDYVSYEKIIETDKVLRHSVTGWFYDKDIINGIYKGDEDRRVKKFFELLKVFQNENEIELFEIKNKGGFFVSSDFYVLKIGKEMYSLEFGVND